MAPHGKIFNLKIIWNFFLGLNSKLLCHTPNCPVTLQITLSHFKSPCHISNCPVTEIKIFKLTCDYKILHLIHDV